MVQEAQALEINKPVQTMAQLHPSCVVYKQITFTSPSLSFLIYKMCVNTSSQL